MPSKNEHYSQFKHNKRFLESGELKKVENYDWAVTIAFYCAVHLLENFFATKSLHNRSHETRNKLIATTKELCRSSVAAKYLAIYNQSLRSRYECIAITQTDITNVKEALSFIESKLSSL